MNRNLSRLHSAFNRGFNPDDFTCNILAMTTDLIDNPEMDIPAKAGIPITDVVMYGHQRIKGMGADYSHLRKQIEDRLLDLVVNTKAAYIPVSICQSPSPNSAGELHCPILAELYFANATKEKPDGYYPDLQALEYVIRRGDRDYGMTLNSSIPLAMIALKLGAGKVKDCKFMSEPVLKSATQFLLEVEADKLNDGVVIHLIDSAAEQGVPLSQLKLRNKIGLPEFFSAIGKNELSDKYRSASQRQEALELINQNSEQINHDFNPDLYFDF
jgi:hypothetical protein